MHAEQENRRSRVDTNYSVAVVTSDGRSFRAKVVDESTDGLGLICSSRISAEYGDSVLIKNETSPRSGVVLYVTPEKRGTRVGIHWMSGHFRQRAKRLCDRSLAPSEFEQVLPSALHSIWQLLDQNKTTLLREFTKQFAALARHHGVSLDGEYSQLEKALIAKDHRAARAVLTQMSRACLVNESHTPHPKKPFSTRLRIPEAASLGVPAWTLGIVACLAGNVICLG